MEIDGFIVSEVLQEVWRQRAGSSVSVRDRQILSQNMYFSLKSDIISVYLHYYSILYYMGIRAYVCKLIKHIPLQRCELTVFLK